jgi:serine/threonine protein kinase
MLGGHTPSGARTAADDVEGALVGEVFAGRYELVDVLGSGGVGTVWRVWDHRENGYRAAKVLRQSDSDSLLRFVRETSRHIDHPHVVAPCGWSGEDDRVLFTMPLVHGGSVAALLADFGALPVGWTVELLRQALAALVAVHEAGLVHRDVKPANLLLDATGRERPHLWLSDFGAAAQAGAPRLTRTDSVIGTPGYLAPEQLHGAEPDPRQDLYALGVVGLQLLTGRPPSSAGDLPVLAGEPRCAAEPRRAGETVDALAGLLRSMTAIDPGQRPAAAAQALAGLDALPHAHDLAMGADPADPVEVFEHVPALPEGWTDQGPVRSGEPSAYALGNAASVRSEAAGTATVVLRRQQEPAPGSTLGSTQDTGTGSRPPVPTAAWLLAAVGVVLIVVAVLVER